jgi:hypothetical protein
MPCLPLEDGECDGEKKHFKAATFLLACHALSQRSTLIAATLPAKNSSVENLKSRAFLLFGQIAPLVTMQRKLPYNQQNFGGAVRHSNRPAGTQIAQADSKIAFMAPADLWFSIDANELYCADDEEIYESAT